MRTRFSARSMIQKLWFRDLDSNQDTQLQRLMSYRLDDPGMAGGNCSRAMQSCTDAKRMNICVPVGSSPIGGAYPFRFFVFTQISAATSTTRIRFHREDTTVTKFFQPEAACACPHYFC